MLGARVGLLVALMVAVLGTTSSTQSRETPRPPSPSPSSSPLYAPDDLAPVIPTRLGSFEMEIDTGSLDDGDFMADAETWRDILRPLGREPKEGRYARGFGAMPDPDDASSHDAVIIEAIRVEGVLAEQVLAGYAEAAAAERAGLDRQPIPAEWLDVDGRHVRVMTGEGGPPLYFYPNGEVLFLIGISGSQAPTLEQVLAELP